MVERDRDRGQVLPLLAMVVLLAGIGAVAMTRLTMLAMDRAAARTAADAAALAAAVDVYSARPVAAANASKVIDVQTLDRGSGDVRVTVEHASGVVASARARPGVPLSSGRRDLAPAMAAAVARAEQLLGRPLPITSGYRSVAEQARLWSKRGANPFPVAPPGTSMHERGLAIDVTSSFAETLARMSEDTGLCRPYPRTDPVHFELCTVRFPSQGGG